MSVKRNSDLFFFSFSTSIHECSWDRFDSTPDGWSHRYNSFLNDGFWDMEVNTAVWAFCISDLIGESLLCSRVVIADWFFTLWIESFYLPYSTLERGMQPCTILLYWHMNTILHSGNPLADICWSVMFSFVCDIIQLYICCMLWTSLYYAEFLCLQILMLHVELSALSVP